MSPIFYRTLGKGHPIVLIHGFCETHEIWNGFADQLAEKFQVFALDLPGFGESEILPTPFSIADVASVVTEWIDQLNLKFPVVVGHSLGGYVTLAMAKKSPEKFAGIGLFQSTAYPDSDERKANRDKVIAFVKTHGTDPFIDTYVPGLFFDKNHRAIPETYRIARKTKLQTLVAYAAAMRDRPSSIDFKEYYDNPVLVLGGDKDVIIPPKIAQEHAHFFTDTEVSILKDVGHMAMFESPEEALKIVEKFAQKAITKLVR